MTKKESYFYLDSGGNAVFPELENYQPNSGDTIKIIIIDNNVCQHLAQSRKNKNKLNPIVKKKIRSLVENSKKSGFAILADLALLELSTNRKNGSVDARKYLSFRKAVEEYLNKHNVFLLPPIFNLEKDIKASFPLMLFQEYCYVHLLKIKTIESEGVNKFCAIKNLEKYLKWAETIQIQLAFPSLVAHALFGGESKARKIIKFEKGKEPLQSVWGAAWDMTYLYFSQNYLAVERNDFMPIFATNDEACGLIGSLFRLAGALKNNGEVHVSLAQITYDFPHYKGRESDIDTLHERILFSQIGRLNKQPNLALMVPEKEYLEKKVCRIFEQIY